MGNYPGEWLHFGYAPLALAPVQRNEDYNAGIGARNDLGWKSEVFIDRRGKMWMKSKAQQMRRVVLDFAWPVKRCPVEAAAASIGAFRFSADYRTLTRTKPSAPPALALGASASSSFTRELEAAVPAVVPVLSGFQGGDSIKAGRVTFTINRITQPMQFVLGGNAEEIADEGPPKLRWGLRFSTSKGVPCMIKRQDKFGKTKGWTETEGACSPWSGPDVKSGDNVSIAWTAAFIATAWVNDRIYFKNVDFGAWSEPMALVFIAGDGDSVSLAANAHSILQQAGYEP